MKNYIPALFFCGLVVLTLLQGFMFANSSSSISHLQDQLTQIEEKIDRLQTATTSDNQPPLTSIINTATPSSHIDLLASSDSDDLLSPENLSKTLSAATGSVSATPTSHIGSNVKTKSEWKAVDVYETTKTSSRITGQILSNKDYVIVERRQGWYLIKLDTNTSAWVQSQFVYETN